MIRIRSKQDGFRRCGIPHPTEPVEYPDDRFSKDEIEILESEPMLVVEHVVAESKDPEDMTVPELKKLLDSLKVEYPANAKKADLVSLVEESAEPPSGDE